MLLMESSLGPSRMQADSSDIEYRAVWEKYLASPTTVSHSADRTVWVSSAVRSVSQTGFALTLAVPPIITYKPIAAGIELAYFGPRIELASVCPFPSAMAQGSN